MSDPRTLLLAILVVSAPWVLVLLVAVLRGYSVTITLTRKERHRD